MRQVDVVLSVLTLVAVGMGVAAYRAWNPISESKPFVSDTQPGQLLVPLAARSFDRARLSVPMRCVNGLLMTRSSDGWGYAIHDGKVVHCVAEVPNQVHLATPEEARRVPSADPSDS